MSYSYSVWNANALRSRKAFLETQRNLILLDLDNAIVEGFDMGEIDAMREQAHRSAIGISLEGVDFDALNDEELAQSAVHARTKENWALFLHAIEILGRYRAAQFRDSAGKDLRALAIAVHFKLFRMPFPLFVCLVRYTNVLPIAASWPPYSLLESYCNDGSIAVLRAASWLRPYSLLQSYTHGDDIAALRAAAKMDIFHACKDMLDQPHEVLMQIAKNLPRAQYVRRAVAAAVISAMKKKKGM